MPDLKTRILAAASREPSATRRDTRKQTALVIAVAMLVDLGLFALCGGVHRGARSLSFVVATQGGSALLALLAIWGAFGRGGSMLGRSKPWLLLIAVATPMVLSAWILSWSAAWPEMILARPERVGLRCLGLSLALAAWPLPLVLRARRERNPVAPALVGAARGGAIGALAWVLVGLWCPLASLPHLALGHLLPLVLLSLLGALLGKRLLGIDSRASNFAPRLP